jgi:hypothetical protein
MTNEQYERTIKENDLYVGKSWPHTSILENGQTIIIEDKIKALHRHGGEVCVETENNYYGPHWIFEHGSDLHNTTV